MPSLKAEMLQAQVDVGTADAVGRLPEFDVKDLHAEQSEQDCENAPQKLAAAAAAVVECPDIVAQPAPVPLRNAVIAVLSLKTSPRRSRGCCALPAPRPSFPVHSRRCRPAVQLERPCLP